MKGLGVDRPIARLGVAWPGVQDNDRDLKRVSCVTSHTGRETTGHFVLSLRPQVWSENLIKLNMQYVK